MYLLRINTAVFRWSGFSEVSASHANENVTAGNADLGAAARTAQLPFEHLKTERQTTDLLRAFTGRDCSFAKQLFRVESDEAADRAAVGLTLSCGGRHLGVFRIEAEVCKERRAAVRAAAPSPTPPASY